MSYVAKPIQVISAPNYYKELSDGRWEIIDPNTQTLSFQVCIDDELGLRRFIPAAGSTFSVIFQRLATFETQTLLRGGLKYEDNTVTKTATVNSDDRSLWTITLTQADVQAIRSGTVKFVLTQSSVDSTWVQNYFIKKNLTEAGF